LIPEGRKYMRHQERTASGRKLRFKLATVTVFTALAALILSACGSSAGSSSTAAESTITSSDQQLLQKYDVSIPSETVTIGMMPFADNLVMSIAMHNKWFADSGITVGPREYSVISTSQQVALMLNGNYEVTSNYGPSVIQDHDGAPSIQLFGLVDDNTGQAIVANPDLHAKSVTQFMAQGMSFSQAARAALAQMTGKRFATDNNGAHRGFVNTLFSIGDFSQSKLGKLYALDDSKMLALAFGGQTDFAKPLGNAQLAELEAKGWNPIITQGDLMKYLPTGDVDAVTGLGNEGLSTTISYYNSHKDTILRLAGVMYRTTDAVQQDLDQHTTKQISDVVPVLNSSAGISVSANEVATVYRDIDPMLTFDQQAQYFVNTKSPYYYKTVYDAQIKAAVAGGVVKSKTTDADDIMGIAQQVYLQMARYRSEYQTMAEQATGLTGDHKKLASVAAEMYAQYDFLDAYRIEKAAVS
jgi:ABC-type nitrate/sulfonate/bicarbonate transport system substrate-binding protein